VANLLIGVDGSALARRAAERAIDILGKVHHVTIVHVVRPAMPIAMGPSTAIAGGIAADHDALAESNEALIRDAEADVVATARWLGIDAGTRVVTGDPGVELCRIADDDGVDVIIVGSHGSGFLKRVLLGSVSHHVLHHAPCPVLVIRDTDDGIDREESSDGTEAATS
jgi:nucleotide-binding universal stress UspA family protein